MFGSNAHKSMCVASCIVSYCANMTALGVIFATFAVFTFAQGERQDAIYGMQGLRIFCDTIEKRDFVSKYELLPGFDLLKLSRTIDSPIEALVTPKLLDQFKNDLGWQNIKYEVVIEDVSKVLEENIALQREARRSRSKNIFKSFPRLPEIVAYLTDIAKQYSDIAQLINIGKSYEGRDLLGLKISSGDEQKPVVVIDAGIHAREWIAPTTALYAIRQLIENSTNHYLFKDVDIYVIPSINPDGYEYSHQNVSTRLWRKTRSVHSGESRCHGVDGNRNFNISWKTTGASSDPCSETYAGPRPFSESETAALRDFLLSLKGQLKVYITLHSFGQYILYPWGFTHTPAKTARQLKCVAEKAAFEIVKHRGTYYTIGSVIETLYPASGNMVDWAMAAAGAEISYTVKLPGGIDGFAPMPREIIPVGSETFDALAVFIQYASKGDQVC